MRKQHAVWVLAVCCVAAPYGFGASQQFPVAGLGPVSKLERVHTGFAVAEGPVSDRHGDLYFSDIHTGHGKIHRLDATGRLSLFVDGTDKANGLKFNAAGELVACQMSGRVVAYAPDGGSVRVLADNYRGKRFNAPNDLAIDRWGGIYFTDPTFGCGLFPPNPSHKAVYYLNPDGDVSCVIDNLPNPNGIVFSPDETTLYVACTFQQDVLAYPVLGPGKLGVGRIFCSLQRTLLPIFVGGDGATVDSAGNLYVTSYRGVQVFDRDGKTLGTITMPECPTNVTFGGRDRKTLYITTRRSLFRAQMLVPGLPPRDSNQDTTVIPVSQRRR